MNKKEIYNLIEEKEKQIALLQKEVETLKKSIITQNNKTEANKYTLEQKLEIYINYFKGRDDVYPYLSINKNNPNIKYYIPACLNEWKKGVCNKTMKKQCKTCQYRENKPLTLETIKNHIYKNQTIGIYPMNEDETCYFLAFDFDDKKEENHIKEDVLAFAKICDEYNVPIAIEKSRSGRGIHCWIFFEDKIKCTTARKLGSLLLSKTLEIRDSMKIDSFDRMFPNQDYLPKGGYGNLIALPFQSEPLKYGNTLFVDRNFITIENQWEYLSSLKKMTESEIFSNINELSNNTIDISNEEFNIKNDLKDKRKNNFKFPKEINIILDNMINIDKANLNAGVKNSFRRIASFANPEFYKKQRMRMSVHNIPMVIDCSKEDEKYLKLPRGTFEYLKILCNENNIKINIIDNRNEGTYVDFKFKGKLRKEQVDALEKILIFENGILKAPTGFGKTVTCCKLIAERKVNTLIITEKLQLLNQWRQRIKEFLNVSEVGQIGGGKNLVTNIIDVASIKTLWNNGKFNEIVKNYGMIIIDECHHLAAYTYESAINTVNSKYVYGVTATPDRENGHTPIIKMQCGDIRYEVDAKKFNKSLKIPMKVIATPTHLQNVNTNITDYSINEINELIVKDTNRNEKIINKIKTEFEKGKNILVLTERIKHLEFFKEKLSSITDNILIFRGGLGKKVLKKYNEINESIMQNKTNKIIVATGSYIGEGFDDSSLDVLFLTMPISGITKVTQYTGRLHRKNKEKKEIIVYDYVDDNFRQTRNMFEKREKTYEKLGYEVNMVEYE